MAKKRKPVSRSTLSLRTVQSLKAKATGKEWEALHNVEGRLARAAGVVRRATTKKRKKKGGTKA